MIRAVFRQLWLRPLEGRELIEAVLREPAFRDRAPAEKALSRVFFAPFEHQEVVTGARFAARARWSRAALAVPPEVVAAAAESAFALRAREGCFESLLAEVRRVVARATLALAFGEGAIDDHFEALTVAAVTDFDRAIKLVAPGDLRLRRRLAAALAPRLETMAATGSSYLALGREAATALSLDERVDHVASVFLGTGIIQLTDVVTHALVALAQRRSTASDAAVIDETIRVFPVNSSLTRLAAWATSVDGRAFTPGEAFAVVPQRLDGAEPFAPGRAPLPTFGFGVGPRACPARRLARLMAEVLLGRYRALGVTIEPGYRHRRSLAQPVRARLGPGPPPGPTPKRARAAFWLQHAATTAITYPRAGLLAAPEIAELVKGR